MEYRGFFIKDTPPYTISKDGREVFTAWWQFNDNLIQAAAMIDASLAFKNLPKEPQKPGEKYAEADETEDESFNAWFQREADNQLNRDEK